MNLPRFVGTSSNGSVMRAAFFTSTCSTSNRYTIDVDRCNWAQQTLVWINFLERTCRLCDIVPMKYTDLFYSPCVIHLYPLVRKLVSNQEQYLTYLKQFDSHEDVINSLSMDERIRYIQDQFDINLVASQKVSVYEYFANCLYRSSSIHAPVN